MNSFFGWLFDTDGFTPRQNCGDWTTGMIWLHVGSDLFIWLAYTSIPLVLLYFVRRRQDLPFSRLFVLFALFILACGFTHLIDAMIFYHPVYRLSGVMKLATAIVSWATVLALIPAVPKVLELMAAVTRAAGTPAVRSQLSTRRPARAWGYIVAILAAVLATLIRRLFDPILENTHPYIVALPAVVFVAWEAGFGPAVLATALSAAAVAHWFLPGQGGLIVQGREYQMGFALFIFTGLGCALLGEAQWHAHGRADLALADARRRQGDLEAEVGRRERVEQELRESEGRFRSMADSVPAMIWVADERRDRTYFNRTWLEFTGRPLGEQLGEGWAAGVHPDDRAGYMREYTAAFEARRPFELEYRLRRHDGAYRWVLARGTPRLTPGGGFLGFSGLCLDITERKEAEETLAERARLAALRADVAARFATGEPVRVVLRECAELLVRHLGAASARVWTLEPGGDELELQASAGPDASPDGRPARVKVGESAVGRIARDRQPHLTNDVPNAPEMGDPAGEGAEGMAAFAGYPLLADGRAVGVLALASRSPLSDAVLADLAPLAAAVAEWISHRRAVAALRENEERFRALTETIPQLVWTAAPDGRCDYLSRQWVAYTGVPGAEQFGYRWLDALHPDDRERAAAVWRAAVAGLGPYDLEYRLRGRDGEYRWFKARGTPLRNHTGQTVQWFGTCTDIDDQKRQAETLERLVRERTTELHRSNKELEQFAYVASHDLQEPLRKIQAFGGRLRDRARDAIDETGRDYLDRMLSSAGRMSRLIDDLLTYSRVTSQARPFVRTDLGAVLGDVLDDLAARVEQTGAAVDAGPLPAIDADPVQIRQLFQNLIGNALKFHKPGTTPTVRVRAEMGANGNGDGAAHPADPVCRLTVTDEGIGFDEKYLGRIFQVFQRLHGRDEYEGTGVGLAICRKIVDRHGGTVTATSAPGRGATFIVTLPARHPAPGAVPLDTPAP